MKITIITLFPKMIRGFFEESIVKRAQDKKIVEINTVYLRDFAVDSYGTVDDRPYGGGAGMVMRVDVLSRAVRSISQGKVVLTSPRGKPFTQATAESLAKEPHLILIAGHYEGVDERVSSFVDEEISLGDFVMTGGEVTIAAVIDSVVRLLPGVLKKEEATRGESFGEVALAELLEVVPDDETLQQLSEKGVRSVRLLEYPQFTRPSDFEGVGVPEELLSGDPKRIKQWQLKTAWETTKKRRPDLLKMYNRSL